MRIFVASWFFPPDTSSEGIKTCKLLRNSKYQYDVVSAAIDKSGNTDRVEIQADNIRSFPIITEDLKVWRDECIRLFEEKDAEQMYDALMTCCMPEESLQVGLAIKEKHPEIKWICSLAEPVANNPSVFQEIEANKDLPAAEKKRVIRELTLPRAQWTQNWLNYPSRMVRDRFFWKDIQEQAFQKADLLISPSVELRDYMDPDGLAEKKFLIIPPPFDESLFVKAKDETAWEEDKVHLTFIGYSDELQFPNPLLHAVKWIRDRYPRLLERLRIHFFGNYPHEVIERAYAWQIQNVFDFSGTVSYPESLAVMKNSDWLLHMDPWFEELSEVGGSVFLAGKLADYMGAGKPVLVLTGETSPAGVLASLYGGLVCRAQDVPGIAKALETISRSKSGCAINREFRQLFDANHVAEDFDLAVCDLTYKSIPAAKECVFGGDFTTPKALTVCVPCFNSASTLRRTLDSLLGVSRVDELEVLVVDDGSTDRTAEIGREYVTRFPNSVMMVSKPNGGHGSGINQGITRASGRYLRIVDSDDWVDAAGLDSELAYIHDLKELPDVIYTPYHIVDQLSGDSRCWPVSDKIEYERLYTFDELAKHVGPENFYFTMHGSSFRTDLLRALKLKLREHSFYTDSEFVLKLIPQIQTAVFLPDPVYRYLQGEAGQSVAPASFVRHYSDHETIVRELIEYEQATDMSESKREHLRCLLYEHLATNYRILFEFDSDLERGLLRAKCFDQWLKENGPLYYDWAGDNIGPVNFARRHAYRVQDVEKAHIPFLVQKESLKDKVKKEAKKVLHSRLFMNQLTYRFILSQKDSNGSIYKAYTRFK